LPPHLEVNHVDAEEEDAPREMVALNEQQMSLGYAVGVPALVEASEARLSLTAL
jgi:hypothetical protein